MARLTFFRSLLQIVTQEEEEEKGSGFFEIEIKTHLHTTESIRRLSPPSFTMTFTPLNNGVSYPSASRGGATANPMRQQYKQQPVAGNGNNNNGKDEGIVQKLQNVIIAIRAERDRAHRERDMVFEKLRSTKEAFQADKKILQDAKDKYVAMKNQSEQTKKDIQDLQKSIEEFQHKV